MTEPSGEAPGLAGYLEQTIFPLEQRAVNSVSDVLAGYGPAATLRLQGRCTAIDGLPNSTASVSITIEDSLDGQHWNHLASMSLSPGGSRGPRSVVNVSTAFAERLRVRQALGSYSGTVRPEQATTEVVLVAQTATGSAT